NGPAYVALVHGLIRLGAVLVPLNLRLAPPELARQVVFSRARLLIHDEWTARQAWSLSPHGALPPFLAVGDAVAPLSSPDIDSGLPRRLSLADPQGIIFTSGTTGRAKGVLLSYGNHWWSAMGSA